VVDDILQIPQHERTQTEEQSRVIASETESSKEETRTNNQNIKNTETTEKNRKRQRMAN
jgi:hypothetical protein